MKSFNFIQTGREPVRWSFWAQQESAERNQSHLQPVPTQRHCLRHSGGLNWQSLIQQDSIRTFNKARKHCGGGRGRRLVTWSQVRGRRHANACSTKLNRTSKVSFLVGRISDATPFCSCSPTETPSTHLNAAVSSQEVSAGESGRFKDAKVPQSHQQHDLRDARLSCAAVGSHAHVGSTSKMCEDLATKIGAWFIVITLLLHCYYIVVTVAGGIFLSLPHPVIIVNLLTHFFSCYSSQKRCFSWWGWRRAAVRGAGGVRHTESWQTINQRENGFSSIVHHYFIGFLAKISSQIVCCFFKNCVNFHFFISTTHI